MTYTATVIPQLVFPSDVAAQMFPTCHDAEPNDWSYMTEPSITWLASPIPLGVSCRDHQPQRLGHPSIVEIVSMCCDNNTTVHGRLALGTPVPVVPHSTPLNDDADYIVLWGKRLGDVVAWSPSKGEGGDITHAIAGTLTPGSVAYPVTVAP